MTNSISLALRALDFELKKDKSENLYTLCFKGRDNLKFMGGDDDQIKMAFTLDEYIFESLVKQATALIPSLNFELPSPEINASWREAAWPLKQLTNRDWQLLLRETSFNYALEVVLWYLKDIDITRRVVSNMTLRAAAQVTRILVNNYKGINPDTLPQSNSWIRNAQDGLREIMKTLNRLIAEGQIKEISYE